MPAIPRQAQTLRDLAHRVGRLGRGDRLDPVGSFVDEKLTIRAELLRLAERAEAGR